MATYSNNVTIKFVTTISLSIANGSSSYVVPAGHFAIIGAASIDSDGAGGRTGSVSVGGIKVLDLVAPIYSVNGSSAGVYALKSNGDIHVAEGGTITVASGDKFVTAKAIGAVFKNTP